jgi:U6 snRNA-associated Sm-like protein LSm1
LDKEDDVPQGYEKADAQTVHTIYMEEARKKKKRDKEKMKKLAGLGFEGEMDQGTA